MTVVRPDVGGDTVTVDVPAIVRDNGQTVGGAPFRLADIPVREG